MNSKRDSSSKNFCCCRQNMARNTYLIWLASSKNIHLWFQFINIYKYFFLFILIIKKNILNKHWNFVDILADLLLNVDVLASDDWVICTGAENFVESGSYCQLFYGFLINCVIKSDSMGNLWEDTFRKYILCLFFWAYIFLISKRMLRMEHFYFFNTCLLSVAPNFLSSWSNIPVIWE